MNALTEDDVREQLVAALGSLDPTTPPLEELRGRARRRRTLQWSGASGLVAAAAALIVVLVLVVSGGSSRPGPVPTRPIKTAPPPAGSLQTYAKAHHRLLVTGPELGVDPYDQRQVMYFGAFTTTRAIVVVRYDRGAWRQDGVVVTALGPGEDIIGLSPGPRWQSGGQPPTFAVRVRGTSVSYNTAGIPYYGAVLWKSVGDADWQAANFGTCGHGKACFEGSLEPLGHVSHGKFVSINASSASRAYRIRWHWIWGSTIYKVGSIHRVLVTSPLRSD